MKYEIKISGTSNGNNNSVEDLEASIRVLIRREHMVNMWNGSEHNETIINKYTVRVVTRGEKLNNHCSTGACIVIYRKLFKD